MDELRQKIKTIIPSEIQQDENVKNNSFVLDPFMVSTSLKGDGTPSELSSFFSLNIFFKNKGELIAKSKSIANTLADYPMSNFEFIWESNARLWRATTIIEVI